MNRNQRAASMKIAVATVLKFSERSKSGSMRHWNWTWFNLSMHLKPAMVQRDMKSKYKYSRFLSASCAPHNEIRQVPLKIFEIRRFTSGLRIERSAPKGFFTTSNCKICVALTPGTVSKWNGSQIPVLEIGEPVFYIHVGHIKIWWLTTFSKPVWRKPLSSASYWFVKYSEWKYTQAWKTTDWLNGKPF